MDDHLVPLAGDWALRRDFAVRSAGFPVAGLDAFGAKDESERLREVAGDPAFREALTWQNRGALATAADGLLKDGVKPSRRRQREEVVARYWQRYCSKNDTIGFFGPLAWGEVGAAGPALAQRSRALVRERSVHLEVWCLERFLQTVTDDPWLPLGPWPEEEARIRIGSIADAAARERAETGLARLEAARGRIAAASREELAPALDEFDRLFEELVGEPPARTPELAGGGRTPVYMDAMRDLDVDLGPGLVAELAASLTPLLESSRWLCGRSFELGCRLIAEAVGSGGPRPAGPAFRQGVLGAAGDATPACPGARRAPAALGRAARGPKPRDDRRTRPRPVFRLRSGVADLGLPQPRHPDRRRRRRGGRAGRVPHRDRRLPPWHEPARAGRLLLPSPGPAAVPRDVGLGRRHTDDLSPGRRGCRRSR